jgi:vancomycin resistance protein YoaR
VTDTSIDSLDEIPVSARENGASSRRGGGGPRRRRRLGSRRSRRAWWLVALVPVVVLGLLVGAWAFDSRGGRVVRNVELGGEAVGGSTVDELERSVADRAASYQDAVVRIETPQQTYETTAGTLGLTLDQAATVRAARREGRSEPLILRPFSWFASLFSSREVPLRFTVDPAVLGPALATLEGENRIAPVEPALDASGDTITVTPGTPGSGLDVDEVAAALTAAAAPGDVPIEVEAEPVEIPPQYTDAEFQAVADQGNELANRQLLVTVAGDSRPLPGASIRSWVSAVPSGDTVALHVDPAAASTTVNEMFADLATPGVDARFDVVNGQPVVVPSQDGTACCDPASAQSVVQALLNNAGGVEVALTPAPASFTTDEANALGIVAEVGQPDEFGPTTRHACCEPRVTNIHRIADIVRGAVVMPGATFSVNSFVGPRTQAKGFVEAPVIQNGEFSTGVGGGVSQFATTLFNAAFFAGLDFDEYQSHSIYISRYPRGREATLSYEHPDLQIVNNSPYGVLIWPTYTGTTITVHLYSTPNVTVTAGSLSSSPQGNCTRVTQPRTRTYTDGRVVQDSVFAVYRPGEGVNC